jgi:hypothetical protein
LAVVAARAVILERAVTAGLTIVATVLTLRGLALVVAVAAAFNSEEGELEY